MYPLSVDQRTAQGEQFRQAKQQLESKLKTIASFYSSPHAEAHTGPPNCERCNTKRRRITEAYYDFYLTNTPWDAADPSLRADLDKTFNNPQGDRLDHMHKIVQSVVREHIRHDLCSPDPADDVDTFNYKQVGAEMFRQDRDTKEILNCYTEAQLKTIRDPNIVEFIRASEAANTPDQRAQTYINYYCRLTTTDTPQQKNFKSKYARMFEQLMPRDVVVTAMRKEAEELQASKLSDLEHRLGELQMAQSAHLKAKARKAEKDKMIHAREASPRYVSCSVEECPLDINVTSEEVIECGICEWLSRKGGKGSHFYYCSVEHAEEDFDNHERREHQCSMGSRCLYSSGMSPAGDSSSDDTELCGICIDCEDHEVVSYFCSDQCYQKNLEAHRDEVHYGRDIPNTARHLDECAVAEELEAI
ncbi:Uncharacterized protein BP5553_01019 [Venustampulla echinocandica]|uniref:Uncharacterized protein n=1 Tax=Venustampulla echinocandica TaxID=2656787 RepID=A0A370TZV5_9HELO|nr:Uncharacterized protein BP5553_01019 [Venustampulla echinocandica]RDL41040.1 Uncharacterized protein BP5553_01019 [Venustampulla echinocandica]